MNFWKARHLIELNERLRQRDVEGYWFPSLQLLHPTASHTHIQVKEIGNFLHSNVLTDLSNQIEQSTEKTMHDFEQSRDDLERHHAKLAQIENEKDQEKRLHKKRE